MFGLRILKWIDGVDITKNNFSTIKDMEKDKCTIQTDLGIQVTGITAKKMAMAKFMKVQN